jgi:xylulose-5-phosphate/fructose-6-phosphate phosphoketolase
MFEVLAASIYLRKLAPSMSVRVINVTDLMILGREGLYPRALSHRDFDILFTLYREIHFNYHGYTNKLQGLLFGRPKLERVSISSFQNELTSTTPFETMLKNNYSRYHVAKAAIRGAAKCNPHIAVDLQKLMAHVQHERAKVEQFIQKHGVDPAGVYDVPRFSKSLHRHRQPDGDQDWTAHDKSFHLPKKEQDWE